MTTTEQTVAHIFESMETDEWLGYGYLGERRNALDSSDPESPAQSDLVAQADRAVLDHANAQGWTRTQLFDWANSKRGRFFGDIVFGGTGPFEDRWADALRSRVLSLPR